MVYSNNYEDFISAVDAFDRYLNEQEPTKSFVAMVMKECCENYRYQFSQFKAVFELRMVELKSTGEEGTTFRQTGTGVEYKGMDVYTKAFQDRVVKAEVETA